MEPGTSYNAEQLGLVSVSVKKLWRFGKEIRSGDKRREFNRWQKKDCDHAPERRLGRTKKDLGCSIPTIPHLELIGENLIQPQKEPVTSRAPLL
jgi:hypothetical protein